MDKELLKRARELEDRISVLKKDLESTAAREYVFMTPNAYMLTCTQDMLRGDFMQELSNAIGLNNSGLSIRESLFAIIRHLVTLDRPLLIFDEADKLRDNVLMCTRPRL